MARVLRKPKKQFRYKLLANERISGISVGPFVTDTVPPYDKVTISLTIHGKGGHDFIVGIAEEEWRRITKQVEEALAHVKEVNKRVRKSSGPASKSV